VSTVKRLVLELFHQAVPEEPVRATRNRSLPAAHFSPTLIGHVLGLAATRVDYAQIKHTLRSAGVASLACDTRRAPQEGAEPAKLQLGFANL